MTTVMIASADAFTWLSLLPFLHSEDGAKYLPLAHSVLVVLIVLLVAWFARMAMMRAPTGPAGLVPDDKLSPRNIFELYTEAILGLCRGVLGKDAETFFPLIAGLFLYIFVSNALGLFPGLLPPTSQLNTNVPMALTVFVIYNVVGLRRNGIVGYFKHFWGPVGWLGPLMLCIEVVSHLSRPLSLSVRLYGNIFGDHLVLEIFLNQLPAAIHAILGYGIPVAFLGLGLFVCFIQAFVFSLLSVMYIGLATSHDH